MSYETRSSSNGGYGRRQSSNDRPRDEQGRFMSDDDDDYRGSSRSSSRSSFGRSRDEQGRFMSDDDDQRSSRSGSRYDDDDTRRSSGSRSGGVFWAPRGVPPRVSNRAARDVKVGWFIRVTYPPLPL